VISQFYPHTIIDGVEIDEGLIEAAKPYFPFSRSPNLRVHVGDARLFLRTAATRYDVIIVDVFRPPHIPFHVATAEFFEEVRRKLTPGGVLAMNVGCRGDKQVCTGISNTLARVFPYVYYSQYFSPDSSGIFTNRLFVASAGDLSLDDPDMEKKVFSVPDASWQEVFQRMRDPRGYDADQHSFFRRLAFNPQAAVYLDDRSSLDMVAEREFLGLILGNVR